MVLVSNKTKTFLLGPLLFGYRQQIAGPNLSFSSLFRCSSLCVRVATELNRQSHFYVYYTKPNIGDIFQDVLLSYTITGFALPIIPQSKQRLG